MVYSERLSRPFFTKVCSTLDANILDREKLALIVSQALAYLLLALAVFAAYMGMHNFLNLGLVILCGLAWLYSRMRQVLLWRGLKISIEEISEELDLQDQGMTLRIYGEWVVLTDLWCCHFEEASQSLLAESALDGGSEVLSSEGAFALSSSS